MEETLPLVRGRVRVADQIAVRPGMMLPLEVRYDAYGTDIVENRIIHTALRRMAAVPRLSSTLKGRLVHLDGRLDGVRVLPHGVPTPNWRLTRANVRYASALRLAEIVLRNQSTEPGAGGITVAAFVVSMPTLFEDFVTIALREALASYPGHTHGQYASHLAEGERIPIRPDVVHVVNGRPGRFGACAGSCRRLPDGS